LWEACTIQKSPNLFMETQEATDDETLVQGMPPY